MTNMQNKRVLVPESGPGLGRGMALAFARREAVMAVHYSHSSAGAAAMANKSAIAGGKAAAGMPVL